MPARSKKQWRWMYATGQPFARRWSHMRSYAGLPASKDAGTAAGAQLHGPSGLLPIAGMASGRKKKRWGARTKAAGYGARAGEVIRGNLKRGNDGKFTSAGTPGASAQRGVQLSKQPKPAARTAPTAPKGGKGSKGKKSGAGTKKPEKQQQTPEQKRAAREAEQAQNRANVLSKMNIAPDGQAALSALRVGAQPDAAALARGGFEQAGLVEQAQDGSYRLTASGRALLSAADTGDAGRAGDTISAGRDRISARTERRQAAAARHADVEQKRQEAAQERLVAAKKKPAGGGSVKPPSIDRGAARQAERAAAAQAAVEASGIGTEGMDALRTAAETGGVRNEQLSALGLIGSDGMTTDQGRRALSALERGDVRGYRAALQDAKARMTRARQASARQQVAQRRQIERRAYARVPKWQRPRTKAETYGGVTRANLDDSVFAGPDRSFPITTAQDVRDAVASLGRTKHDKAAVQRGIIRRARAIGATDALPESWRTVEAKDFAPLSFAVFKDARGQQRWIARTTTAYCDRDGEILSVNALDQDSQRMTATKQFGPLRWWHIGDPDPLDAAQPWGPGLDIGDCDYSVVIGRTRVESGTFRDAAVARGMARIADTLEMSPGFFHPADQPGADGVFYQIRTFERSPVPTRYGRASNLFTGFAVKELRMDVQEMERRFKAMITELQLAPAQAEQLAAGLVQTEKAAAQQGITYKSEDDPPAPPAPPEEIVIGGVTYTVKAAPPLMDAEDNPAMGGDMGVDEAAEGDPPMDDGGEDVVGNMPPDAFAALLSQALSDAIAPLVKAIDITGKMTGQVEELKGMFGGVATKDDARAQEIAGLKAQIGELASNLAALEGDQPAVALPVEVEAALKSTGPAAPAAPAALVAPDDPDRPWAGWGALTFPELYGRKPN